MDDIINKTRVSRYQFLIHEFSIRTQSLTPGHSSAVEYPFDREHGESSIGNMYVRKNYELTCRLNN